MEDIEKLVMALRHIRCDGDDCMHCPCDDYRGNCKSGACDDGTRLAAADALERLNKFEGSQVEKLMAENERLRAELAESQRRERAAVVESGVNPDGTIRYVCPNAQCGHLFWDRQYVTAYCPDCGQALSSNVPIYDDDRGPGAGEGDNNGTE